MDPITTAASAATTLRNLAALVPPGGTRGARRHHDRLRAYLDFQRTVHGAESWAVHLRLLHEVKPTPWPLIVDKSDQKLTALMAALDALRLLGNPKPRKEGEELVALLAALFEAIGEPRLPARGRQGLALIDASPYGAKILRGGPISRRIDAIREVEETWQNTAARFVAVQQAMGRAHRNFTLAAREDLGHSQRWHIGGKLRTRWWQRWRLPDPWPGGFPPPDADTLIEGYRAEAHGLAELEHPRPDTGKP